MPQLLLTFDKNLDSLEESHVSMTSNINFDAGPKFANTHFRMYVVHFTQNYMCGKYAVIRMFTVRKHKIHTIPCAQKQLLDFCMMPNYYGGKRLASM